MGYQVGGKSKLTDIERMLFKAALVGIGLIIGASFGMYYAVQHIPLPDREIIYVSR